MSAPLHSPLCAFNLIKRRCLMHFRSRITSTVQSCKFSDDKSDKNSLEEAENLSNNSLQRTKTDDLELEDEIEEVKVEKASFAKAFEKIEALRTRVDVKPASNRSFASLLRHSKLVQLGDASDKIVVGEIFEVHRDDLYIDFGGKFPCVCPKPQLTPWKYRRGTKVRISLNSLEMASRFIGVDKHITLLEADATLQGLHESESDIHVKEKQTINTVAEDRETSL